ncbi:hypothetical protein ZOSMA_236G00150 [Zostera marina]|uniref:Uncharacterized protein n=1 Tax=Zostera marina TaxID=29655 RepID=A0A0K9PI09_ZOSMR|nr:hypothetical protein ZOSMA_236G00150 [Zostera marina]
MLVEEGQSMYNQMLIDENHVEQNVISVDGMGTTQLLVRSEFSANSHSSNSSQLFETPIRKERHNKAMPFGSSKKGISSPEFWACAVASADEIEKKLKARPNLQPDDLADVVRCLDFSPSSSADPDSPYVCSMIKRIKDRNADKLERKKLKESKEASKMKDNNESKKNQTTKRLVMRPEYCSLFFYLIVNDVVFCAGQDLLDIIQHKTYDALLVNVLFGVIRVELKEKLVVPDMLQFLSSKIFNDSSVDQYSSAIPEKCPQRHVEIVLESINRSMSGIFKRTMDH